jgi:hypothetical protein
MPQTHVRVRLVQDTETQKVSFEVAIRSNVKPLLWCHGLVDADAQDFRQQCDRKAQMAAEWQVKQHGDRHDPKDCGKLAAQAAGEIYDRAMRASTRDAVGVSTMDKAFEGTAREANGK